MNIEKLIKWVEAGNRKVTIEIGGPGSWSGVSIWVYDYELTAGVFVDAPDQIDAVDLVKTKREDLERQIQDFEKIQCGGL